jgi:hypothetical protein
MWLKPILKLEIPYADVLPHLSHLDFLLKSQIRTRDFIENTPYRNILDNFIV